MSKALKAAIESNDGVAAREAIKGIKDINRNFQVPGRRYSTHPKKVLTRFSKLCFKPVPSPRSAIPFQAIHRLLSPRITASSG
jgi:hypothetical protein